MIYDLNRAKSLSQRTEMFSLTHDFSRILCFFFSYLAKEIDLFNSTYIHRSNFEQEYSYSLALSTIPYNTYLLLGFESSRVPRQDVVCFSLVEHTTTESIDSFSDASVPWE